MRARPHEGRFGPLPGHLALTSPAVPLPAMKAAASPRLKRLPKWSTQRQSWRRHGRPRQSVRSFDRYTAPRVAGFPESQPEGHGDHWPSTASRRRRLIERDEPPPRNVARAAQRVISLSTGSLVEVLPEHDALRLTIRLLDSLADFQRELDSRPIMRCVSCKSRSPGSE